VRPHEDEDEDQRYPIYNSTGETTESENSGNVILASKIHPQMLPLLILVNNNEHKINLHFHFSSAKKTTIDTSSIQAPQLSMLQLGIHESFNLLFV